MGQFGILEFTNLLHLSIIYFRITKESKISDVVNISTYIVLFHKFWSLYCRTYIQLLCSPVPLGFRTTLKFCQERKKLFPLTPPHTLSSLGDPTTLLAGCLPKAEVSSQSNFNGFGWQLYKYLAKRFESKMYLESIFWLFLALNIFSFGQSLLSVIRNISTLFLSPQ